MRRLIRCGKVRCWRGGGDDQSERGGEEGRAKLWREAPRT